MSEHLQWSAKVLAPYVREMSKYVWSEASRRNIRESYRTRERVYIKNLKLVMTVDIISLRWKCAGDQVLLTGKRDDRLSYTIGTTDINLPLQSLVWRRSRLKSTTSQDDHRWQQSSWAMDSKKQWGNSRRNGSKAAAGARPKCFPRNSEASTEKDGI